VYFEKFTQFIALSDLMYSVLSTKNEEKSQFEERISHLRFSDSSEGINMYEMIVINDFVITSSFLKPEPTGL